MVRSPTIEVSKPLGPTGDVPRELVCRGLHRLYPSLQSVPLRALGVEFLALLGQVRLDHAKARECRCGLLESLRCRGRIKQRIASEISGELDFQRVGRQRCIFKPRTRAYQLLIGGRQQPRFAQPVSVETGGLVVVGTGEQLIDLTHVS